MFVLSHRCFRARLQYLQKGGCCPPTAGISSVSLCKQKYLYRQNQYPKPWSGKYHIRVIQRFEHSACNGEAVGSIPIRMCYFPLHKISNVIKNNWSQSKMGAVARARLAFCVSLYKQKYLNMYQYGMIGLVPQKALCRHYFAQIWKCSTSEIVNHQDHF